MGARGGGGRTGEQRLKELPDYWERPSAGDGGLVLHSLPGGAQLGLGTQALRKEM